MEVEIWDVPKDRVPFIPYTRIFLPPSSDRPDVIDQAYLLPNCREVSRIYSKLEKMKSTTFQVVVPTLGINQAGLSDPGYYYADQEGLFTTTQPGSTTAAEYLDNCRFEREAYVSHLNGHYNYTFRSKINSKGPYYRATLDFLFKGPLEGVPLKTYIGAFHPTKQNPWSNSQSNLPSPVTPTYVRNFYLSLFSSFPQHQWVIPAKHDEKIVSLEVSLPNIWIRRPLDHANSLKTLPFGQGQKSPHYEFILNISTGTDLYNLRATSDRSNLIALEDLLDCSNHLRIFIHTVPDFYTHLQQRFKHYPQVTVIKARENLYPINEGEQ